MERLSKKDLDYLVRTILPELYERKAKKRCFHGTAHGDSPGGSHKDDYHNGTICC